ncbi:MAG: transcriptional repressor NrdR [Candidatus Omnitrophica bacterium]|nr:transcriptional repressor NrdR [Candidatus Omnitrophota bacterium]MBL7151435.1 transcriptional repressor NrdR [Candidatus Omnitrophota bacterium]MBL7210616.1 transcriptional repressor NrdR [Candidatus Omnitrophota bacterium]
MRCPSCGYKEDKVVDSRSTSEESAVRRRRECLKCGRRFTTYEYIEEVSLMVIKKDGRREPFDRKKILSGIIKACEKRPISMEKMEAILTQVERAVQKKSDREVSSTRIGELVIDRLKGLDDVAYVRFASVYRQFKDVGQFMDEFKVMLGKEKQKPGRVKKVLLRAKKGRA